MGDDSNYMTPYEAALAIVATAMKKSRLPIDALILNAILGGIYFSCGGLLLLAGHCDNPELYKDNPGILNGLSGFTFAIGLFYVVVTGADLYNSNILYFSVGLLRRAVSIYDCFISLFISWLGNIAGSLFVSYIFGYLSGIGKQKLWKVVSREIVEEKASYSFIETFLKGIAGNFLVSLAIYLQLMAKPIHVRFFVLFLPIYTFITIGFTHTVGDQAVSFVGMYNGASVTPGEFIWKLLIPASVGNLIGGFAFGLVVPFYLQLIIVERDNRKLNLPEYDMRDDQPHVNADSRIIKVKPSKKAANEKLEKTESDDEGSDTVLSSTRSTLSANSTTESNLYEAPATFMRSNRISASASPIPLETASSSVTGSSRLAPITTRNTFKSNSSKSKSSAIRSPPGVFPVHGMGEPLHREKTIQNSNFPTKNTEEDDDNDDDSSEIAYRSKSDIIHPPHDQLSEASEPHPYSVSDTTTCPPTMITTSPQSKKSLKKNMENYNVLKHRPGAQLQRILTSFMRPSATASQNDLESNNYENSSIKKSDSDHS